MSIEIKKIGKNIYYRKDGNKMGGRKERQEVMKISIKHWERDMAVRHRAGTKTMTGWGQFEGMMAGGFKRGEMAMVGAICGAFPEDHFKSNVALAAVRSADRGNVVMFGMEHEFDHTDRLAEELKIHEKYMPYNRPIQLVYVDGVPYNPMDEFDRPWMYDSNKEEIKLLSEPKHPLEKDNYTACIINDNGDILLKEQKGYDARAEALSMLYTRLRNEENNESKKD